MILNDIVLPAVVLLLLGRVPLVRFGVVRDQHHRLVVVAQRRRRFRPSCWTARELAVRGRRRRCCDRIAGHHAAGRRHRMDVVDGVVLGVDLLRLHVHRVGLDVAGRELGTILVDRLLAVVAVAGLGRDVVVVAVRIDGRDHVGAGRDGSDGLGLGAAGAVVDRVVTPRGRVLVGGDLLLGRRQL